MNFCGISVDVPCLVNKNFIGNTKLNVGKYPTKHRASYDLAIGENDQSGKFSGADRRRKNHIVVVANSDMKTSDVARKLISKRQEDFDDYDYWHNINQFAWSRKPEHIRWEIKEDKIVDEVLKLNSEYEDFELEYGVLGKGGINVFLKQLPAVAILHGSINGELVIVKEEHAIWLRELYDEELEDLGLKTEKREKEILIKHCKKILENCTPDTLNILKLISTYGSQSSVESHCGIGRSTIWRNFKHPIEYSVKLKKTNQVITKYYSLIDGSVNSIDDNENFAPNGKIQSFSKKDGTISLFGRLILEELKKDDCEMEDFE